MLKRVYDPEECKQITKHYPDYFTFDETEWFSNPANYAIREGENIGFAEYKSPGVYLVHFCLHTARGREAINLTKRFIDQLWGDMPITIAVGLVEENNKKARWVLRQVGFESSGFIDTADNGNCEMFSRTSPFTSKEF